MPGVSKEQINRAKEVDILDYLRTYEPCNLKRIGNAYYLKDHDSFEISNGLWNWHSRDVGGRNVIDYLMKVRGYDFVEAVTILAGNGISLKPIITDSTKRSKPKLPFQTSTTKQG